MQMCIASEKVVSSYKLGHLVSDHGLGCDFISIGCGLLSNIA